MPPCGARALGRRCVAGPLQRSGSRGCPVTHTGPGNPRGALLWALCVPRRAWAALAPQDSGKATRTHLLLILALKKFFFSVLFTICFFPWLKIIGDETPTARSPAWSRKERGEERRPGFLLQRDEPARLSAAGVHRGSSSPPFSWSPGQGPGRLVGAWGRRARLLDFYQPSSPMFLFWQHLAHLMSH